MKNEKEGQKTGKREKAGHEHRARTGLKSSSSRQSCSS